MQGSAQESMAVEYSFTFLGTGTSVGVPVIGCVCGVCQSIDSRNRRLRSSILVRDGRTAILVDSGPDLRAQALREGFTELDAVIYTHEHLDHVVGFDELRAFCWKRDEPLPMHGTAGCLRALRQMFAWAFSERNIYKGYVKPDPQVLDGPFFYENLKITPLPVEHGEVEAVGYLFQKRGSRSMAYMSDVKKIPEETMQLISGVDVMVVDSLRPAPHPTHFSLDEALAAIAEAQPGEAWLTHLGHENDHRTLEASLPIGVKVAYDGLMIEL